MDKNKQLTSPLAPLGLYLNCLPSLRWVLDGGSLRNELIHTVYSVPLRSCDISGAKQQQWVAPPNVDPFAVLSALSDWTEALFCSGWAFCCCFTPRFLYHCTARAATFYHQHCYFCRCRYWWRCDKAFYSGSLRLAIRGPPITCSSIY